MNKVFEKFSAVWGTVWSGKFNEETSETLYMFWVDCISPLSDKQFIDTVNFCCKTMEFPPTPAAFIDAARSKKEQIYFESSKRFISDESMMIAEQYLNKMKNILSASSKDINNTLELSF